MNKHIKNALLHGRLILLFGAGASRGSRNKLNFEIPLGGELAKILAKEMGEEYQDEDLSEVYSAAKSVLGEQVHKIFEKHFKHCTPSKEYADILKYPFFRIYSLNIDDAFENASSKYGTMHLNVKQRTDNITEPDQFYKTLDFIKLNGDINRTKEGYIFSAQEYASGSSSEPLWYEELARDFHKYTFIFIGTQLKEPLFNHQVEKYKAKVGSSDLKSYILIPQLTSIQEKSLLTSNIHHLQGKLGDLTDWLAQEFTEPPTSNDIVANTRPELIEESKRDNKHLTVFSGVTPVSRSSLALLKKNKSKSVIRDFYKGFKPSWFDIVDEVPALLCKTEKYYQSNLITSKSKPLDLHILFGTAGCGKSTVLKQLALKLSDEGNRSVYFVEEYKDRFQDLITELDYRNSDNYYVVIERIGGVAADVAQIIKGGKSLKAIFISSENTRIWNTRVKHHLSEFLTDSLDISHIVDNDADLILEKLEKFGNWTRFEKIPKKKRKIELLRKAKKQLLIGLIEATSGEGYNQIIKNDYKSITCESEKALLMLAGLATLHRVPSHESTLTRALSILGLEPNVYSLASRMEGIVKYVNGSVTTRHSIYIETLFEKYISQNELIKVIHAYIESFSVYNFPIVKSISKSEFTIYKHLVNNKSLNRLLRNSPEKVLPIYERFEKAFENEGLFLMHYGLALRSFGKNKEAYEKLRIAQQAYPESPHIEHALAQQRIVLACKESDETIAMALFADAEIALNRLDSANILAGVDAFDRYPIITLSEGHVKVLDNLGYKKEAKVLAKQYYDRINKMTKSETNSRLMKTVTNLMKFCVSGRWPDKN